MSAPRALAMLVTVTTAMQVAAVDPRAASGAVEPVALRKYRWATAPAFSPASATPADSVASRPTQTATARNLRMGWSLLLG